MTGKRFQDKVVIVTGSSNGIGRATAQLFAEQGAKVTITGRNAEALEETKRLLISVGSSEDRIVQVVGDLTDEGIQKGLIEKTVDKFGQIDVLVNNAGGTAPDNTRSQGLDQDISCFDYVMNLNTKSVPYYAASKAALDQLTRAMSITYIADGVRVNSVNPGGVATTIMQKQGLTEQMVNDMQESFGRDTLLIPIGRIGEAPEIAEAIAFLADPKTSSFIVGHTLVVDGGSSISNPMSHNPLLSRKEQA